MATKSQPRHNKVNRLVNKYEKRSVAMDHFNG